MMIDELTQRLRDLPPPDLDAPPDLARCALDRAGRRRTRRLAAVAASAVVAVAAVAVAVVELAAPGGSEELRIGIPAVGSAPSSQTTPDSNDPCTPGHPVPAGKVDQCGHYSAVRAPKPTNYTPPPAAPPDLGPQGLLTRVVPPFTEADGSVGNGWQLAHGGYEFTVLAGAQKIGGNNNGAYHAAVFLTLWKYDKSVPTLTSPKEGW